MTFDPNNCALGFECCCAGDPDYFKCSNWARSALAAPRINHGEPHYTGMSRAAVQKRLDLKAAAEYSILNGRAFTSSPLPTDKSPTEIRRDALERKRERQRRQFRKTGS